MSKLRVIGVCGAPRPNGNTEKLIKEVLKGCKTAGAEEEFISLRNVKISFCKACFRCLKEGKCVLDDDLNKIREKMINSDGLVIGSPNYIRAITGQMKAFLDRLFYDMYRHIFSGKYAVCVTTSLFSPAYTQKILKDLTIALGYYVVGTVDARLLKFENEVERDRKTMKNAFDMGLELVKAIKTKKRYLRQALVRRFLIEPAHRKLGKLLKEKGLL